MKKVILLSIAFRDAYDVCSFIKSLDISPSLLLPCDMIDLFNLEFKSLIEMDEDLIDYIESDISEFIYLLGDELYTNNKISVEVMYNKIYYLNVICDISKKMYNKFKNKNMINILHGTKVIDTGNY